MVREVVERVCLASLDAVGNDYSKWLTSVDDFLSDPSEEESHPVPGKGVGKNGAAEACKLSKGYFWQELVQFTTRKLVQELGAAAFELFEDADWLVEVNKSGMPRHVALEVRTAINTELGGLFRSGSPGTRDAVLAIISRLSVGGVSRTSLDDQVERAFFILCHTSITDGAIGVKVDPELHLLLRDLANNKRLRRTNGPRLKAVLRANGLS